MEWTKAHMKPLYLKAGIPQFFVLSVEAQETPDITREKLRQYLLEKYAEDAEYIEITTEYFYTFFIEVMKKGGAP